MQLSKEMSFLTSFFNYQFGFMIQLNIAVVLCSNIVAPQYYVSVRADVCVHINNNKKTS